MILPLEFKLGYLSSLSSASLTLIFGSSSLPLVPVERTVFGWNSLFLFVCVVCGSVVVGKIPSLKDLKKSYVFSVSSFLFVGLEGMTSFLLTCWTKN